MHESTPLNQKCMERFLSGLPRLCRGGRRQSWCGIGADDQGYITAHVARAKSDRILPEVGSDFSKQTPQK